MSVDLEVEREGTIYLLRALSGRGAEWLNEHVIADDTLMFGEAVVVEHRYIAAIAEGAIADGLLVR
jgi:hypothetical protein